MTRAISPLVHETPRDELLRLSLALTRDDARILDDLTRWRGGSTSSALRYLIREWGKSHSHYRSGL